MEKQKNESKSAFSELPLRILFAILGGIGGLALWLLPVYLADYILYFSVLIVGIGVGSGIKKFSTEEDGNLFYGFLALIITLVLLVIGDVLESQYIFGGIELEFEEIIEYTMIKMESDPPRAIFYALAPLAAAWTGFAKAPNS